MKPREYLASGRMRATVEGLAGDETALSPGKLAEMKLTDLHALHHNLSSLQLMLMRVAGEFTAQEAALFENLEVVQAFLKSVLESRATGMGWAERAAYWEESLAGARNDFLAAQQHIQTVGPRHMTADDWQAFETNRRLYEQALEAVQYRLHALSEDAGYYSEDRGHIESMFERVTQEERDLRSIDSETQRWGDLVSRGFIVASMTEEDARRLIECFEGTNKWWSTAVEKFVDTCVEEIISEAASRRHAAHHIAVGAKARLQRWAKEHLIRSPGSLASNDLKEKLAGVVDECFDKIEQNWAGSDPAELAELRDNLTLLRGLFAERGASESLLNTIDDSAHLIGSAHDDAAKPRH